MTFCSTCQHRPDIHEICFCRCHKEIVNNIPDSCQICNKIADVKFYIDSWLCRVCFNILEDLKK